MKDLRDYLHLHETPTQMCREKEELVELVLAQQAPRGRSSGSAESHSQPSAPLPSLPLAESEPLTEEEDEDEEEEEEGDGEEGEEDDDDDEEEVYETTISVMSSLYF